MLSDHGPWLLISPLKNASLVIGQIICQCDYYGLIQIIVYLIKNHSFPAETKITTMAKIPLPLPCSVTGMGTTPICSSVDHIRVYYSTQKNSTDIVHCKRQSLGNVVIMSKNNTTSQLSNPSVVSAAELMQNVICGIISLNRDQTSHEN